MTFIAHSSAFGIRNPSRRIHHSSFIIHRSSFIPALAIVCLSFSGSAAQALELSSGAEQVCFVFTGTRHSELEPCGCHDLQSGGVDHEAYIFDGLRKTYPNFVAMEVGAWTDPFMNPNERLKTDFLVKALGEMRFTVFNITPYDLAFGTTYPLQLAQDGGCLISANVHVSPRNSPTTTTAPSRPYDPYTIVEVPRRDGRRPIRVGVIGVTDSRALDFRGLAQLKSTTQIPDCVVFSATETLKAYLPQIRKQADYVIALAMMDLKSAQAMPAIEGMDLLVTTKDDQSQAAMAAVHTSTWVHTGFYGRSFHKVILTFDEENRPIRISGSREDVPLASPSVAAMTNLLDQYREETKKLTRKMEVAIEKSRYIGRVSCINCHSSQYMQWTRTAHNFAYLTLADKNQGYNPDCLKCHVTAYDEPDGFVDVAQTSHLLTVQCEACHGPAKEHVKALTEMVKPDAAGKVRKVTSADEYPHLTSATAESLCVKCHDKEHDPNFDYERDLKLISHKNTQGPFRRKDLGQQIPLATIAPPPSPQPPTLGADNRPK